MDIKKFIAGCILLFGPVATADISLEVTEEGILKEFPACSVPGFLPPVYYPTTQKFLNENSGSIASAGRRPPDGRHYIMYDRNAFKVFHPAFQRWVLAHECAHHTLGHTMTLFQPANRAKVERDERDADCMAAKMLKDMSDEHWAEAFAEMSNQPKISQFSFSGARWSPEAKAKKAAEAFGYHSDHKGRVKTVKQCLANARK